MRLIPYVFTPRAKPHVSDLDGVRIFDLRHEALDPHPHASHGHAGSKHTKRCRNMQRTTWEQTAAIRQLCIHQTGVELPPSKQDRSRARGDEDLAHALRVMRSAYHVAVLRSGSIVRTCPLLEYRFHANALNSTSVGVAVVGQMPGLTDAQVETLPLVPALVSEWLAEEIAALADPGSPPHGLSELVCHRQSNPDRRGDPGPEIWELLAPVAREFGWRVPAFAVWRHPTKGPGRPVPESWDPKGVGSY
jgi:hypothetical protein